MTDDRRGSTTRRGLIGLAADVGLAGCSALPNPFDAPPPRLDGARLTEVTAGGVPTIPDTVPVAVADDHVTAAVDRTEGLLSQAPLPFDGGELPNGAMREEMNGTAAARTELDRASDADSPLEALAMLRDARGNARAVATTWAYADDGLRRTDIADDADALGDDVAAFRDHHSTVGDDPVRAVLVHEVVESLARLAANGAAGRPENPRGARATENLVTVSERAADLERGSGALETATYLYGGFRADLEEPRDLESVFEAVAAELSGTVT